MSQLYTASALWLPGALLLVQSVQPSTLTIITQLCVLHKSWLTLPCTPDCRWSSEGVDPAGVGGADGVTRQ